MERAILGTVRVPPIEVIVNNRGAGTKGGAFGDSVTKIVVNGNRFTFGEKLKELAQYISCTEDVGIDSVTGGQIVVLLRKK